MSEKLGHVTLPMNEGAHLLKQVGSPDPAQRSHSGTRPQTSPGSHRPAIREGPQDSEQKEARAYGGSPAGSGEEKISGEDLKALLQETDPDSTAE